MDSDNDDDDAVADDADDDANDGDDNDDDDVIITALTLRLRWSSQCGSRCGRRPPSSSGIILVIGSRHQHEQLSLLFNTNNVNGNRK